MKTMAYAGLCLLVLLAAAITVAITLGGPAWLPAAASIVEPFKGVDFSSLPPLQRFGARDGVQLAYRLYPAQPARAGSVVLVHGSAGSATSMHGVALELAKAGFDVYALDIRGHGDSGTKGQIAHEGQLEEDLLDFVQATHPAAPSTLAGFSSGGGFALRIAADPQADVFDHYLLLSPFLGQDAPTAKPQVTPWASVGIPRIIALSLLHRMGIEALSQLPVIRFALDEPSKARLTPEYSFLLAQNFRPRPDYRAQIRAVTKPFALIAGTADEQFHADRFEGVFRSQGQAIAVTLVPGIGHIPLILDPQAQRAIVQSVRSLHARGQAPDPRS